MSKPPPDNDSKLQWGGADEKTLLKSINWDAAVHLAASAAGGGVGMGKDASDQG